MKNKLYIDPKSRFQEVAQEKVGITPSYKVLKESGPDHAKTFEIGVFLNKELVATGSVQVNKKRKRMPPKTLLSEKNGPIKFATW